MNDEEIGTTCPKLPFVFSPWWSGKKSTVFHFDSSLISESPAEPINFISAVEYLSTKQPIREQELISDESVLTPSKTLYPVLKVPFSPPKIGRLPKLVKQSYFVDNREINFRDNEKERPLVGSYLIITNTAREIRRSSK